MTCHTCDWHGPELPGSGQGRELHRALHALGSLLTDPIIKPIQTFLEWILP